MIQNRAGFCDGISRRSFLKFCSLTAASLGLGPSFNATIAHAMENKPRIPVLWLHGLECTCCSESFIRSSHPIAQDIVLNMISLDYDDTLQAAAGEPADAAALIYAMLLSPDEVLRAKQLAGLSQ